MADTNYATAFGYESRATGLLSTAFGLRAIASASFSTAFGVDSKAEGFLSTAYGDHAVASGSHSTAFGFYTQAKGHQAIAMGARTLAHGFASTVTGMYNDTIVAVQTAITDTTPMFIVGNGSSHSSRSNAMVVRKDGRIGIGTNSPDTTLHVVGKVKIEDGNQAAGKVLVSDSSGMATWNAGALSLVDADNDTKITVEKTSDDDIIRFDTEGVEYFRMDSGRLEVLNTGGSIFIGDATGANDDRTDNLNTVIGDSAMYNSTSGHKNVAIGNGALLDNQNGEHHTAIGFQAMYSNTEGHNNVGVGWRALFENTTGAFNTATGVRSIYFNTSGNYNTAFGNSSLEHNITGSYNTAIGYNANVDQDSLVNATAIGANATVGASNSLVLGDSVHVGIGTSSPSTNLHVVGRELIVSPGNSLLDLYGSNTIGTWLNLKNTSTGGNGYNLISTGSANGEGVNKFLIRSETAWFSNGLVPGFQMDSKNQIGLGVNNPTAQMSMGEWNNGRPGDSIQLLLSGWHNWGANDGSANGTYKLKIEGYQNDGPTVYPLHVRDENGLVDFYLRNRLGAGNQPLMYFAGDVGIGTETPNVELDVIGDIEYTGSITDVSDIRYKEDITPIENALERISKLNGYSYTMKNEPNGPREHGVIAQEVQEVFPEMVKVVDPEDEMLGVSYMELIPVLIESVKELDKINNQTRSQLSQVEKENAILKAQMAELMKRIEALED